MSEKEITTNMALADALTLKYKNEIKVLKERLEYHEQKGSSKMCISINKEIQILNKVISDINRMVKK